MRRVAGVGFLTLAALASLAPQPASWAQAPGTSGPLVIPAVLKHLDKGGVVVTHGGEALYAHRADEAFVPASTLKIATGLAAIHYLGSDYRFRTEVYLSPANDLVVRGLGDPFLVSEEWRQLVQGLRASGRLPGSIGNLYLDASAFAADLQIPGIASSLDPYNASNGALAANFNTANVRIDRGRVVSAESQTPLTAVARRLAGGLGAGTHRINLSREAGAPLRHAGELAAALLAEAGHPVTGRIVERAAGAEDRLIYTHRNSRELSEVVAAMMLYSNNFIANQLLLAIGLEQGGTPATLAGSVAHLEGFLIDEIGLEPGTFEVVEGSGISRRNRFTPRSLAKVVEAFHPHRHLLSQHRGVQLKTGTLTGVYSLAGFLPSRHPIAFAILLEQKRNTRDAVLDVLKRETPRAFEPRIAP